MLPRWFTTLSLATVITGWAAVCHVHAQPPATLSASGEARAMLGDRVWSEATAGKFDVVQRLLETAGQNRRFRPLQVAWQDFQTQDKQRTDTRRQQYQEAFDRISEALGDDDFDEALNAAIEARDVADDGDAFLKKPAIEALVGSARKRAKQAEKQGAWLEAMSLYRRLDLLFDEHHGVSDDLMRVGTHLRLLRMYAPDELQKLYVARAKELDEDPPAQWDDGHEGWEYELRGVEVSMLHQAYVRAARQHVEGSDYETLMLGSIEALQTLMATPKLEKTFPGLKNEKAVARFNKYLKELHGKVAARKGDDWMTYLTAVSMVRALVEENKATVKLPEAVLTYEMANGATSQLDDFTAMIWPSDMERFARTTEGNFSGIGIQITLKDGRLVVVSPLEGTPAHRAGIKPGDEIAEIEGKSTEGIRLDQAVDAITGEVGTSVNIGVLTPGDKEPRQLKLTRAKIKIASVKGWERKEGNGWNYYIDPTLKIGYVRLTNFGPETADDLDRAVAEMTDAAGINGLVIDLRFNPGGLLSAAVDISNRFVDEGVIVSAAAPGADEPWRARADDRGTYQEFPVVVLINGSSASASEIVSGCLQEHDRAIVVGERTYGKGSVQQLFPLSLRKAYLKLTTQYYMLPSGRIIHRRPHAQKWGVDPDIEVEMTGRQVSRLLDARTALDIIREPATGTVPADDDKKQQDADAETAGDDDPDVAEVAATQPALEKEQAPERAEELLTRGLDPQLQVAVMLLKAKVLAGLPESELPDGARAEAEDGAPEG